MKELPTVRHLAKAPPQKIHKLWEGLGYYTRVRNLQKAAHQVVKLHREQVPADREDLLALPGVGRYTAGAIASIAFGKPMPVVDGNVIRVLSRLFMIPGNPGDKLNAERYWTLAGALAAEAFRQPECALHFGVALPACSAVNQALMELGAVVCTPRTPRCEECPMRASCLASHSGTTAEFPEKPPRPAVTAQHFRAFLVRSRGRILARQRPDGVVNAHLWELPNVEVAGNRKSSPAAELSGILGATVPNCERLGTVRHSITRFRIRVEVFTATWNGPSPRDLKWLSRKQASAMAFTSAHRRAVSMLQVH